MSFVQTGFKPTLSRSITSSGTTIWVSSNPVSTVGYLILDPGTSKEELIKYEGTSTSPNRLTTVTRGLSFTAEGESATGTAYAHNAGSKAKMTDNHILFNNKLLDGAVANSAALPTTNNWDDRILKTQDDNALHTWDETNSTWEDIAAPSSPGDASDTVKGITMLSVAPASATSPIAIGDNDTTIVKTDQANTITGTSSDLTITQTKVTGNTLLVQRDLSSASTNDSVLNVIQDHATDDQVALELLQDGTANGIQCTATSDNSTSRAGVFTHTSEGADTNYVYLCLGGDSRRDTMKVYRNIASTATGKPVIDLTQDHASDDQVALAIQQNGTGNSISADQNGNVGTAVATDGAIHVENTGNTGIGLGVYSNIGAAAAELVSIKANNASFDQIVLSLNNQGTADAVSILNAGASNGITVNQDGATGNAVATDGAIHVENTGNTGIGIGVYSNIGATAAAPLVSLHADDAAFDQECLAIVQDGVAEGIKVTTITGNDNAMGMFLTDTSGGATTNTVVLARYADNSGGFGSNRFYRNLANTATAGAVVNIVNDHASDDQDALAVGNDGTGRVAYLKQDGNATTLELDYDEGTDRVVMDVDTKTASGFQLIQNDNVTTDLTMKLGARYYWTDTDGYLRTHTSDPSSDTDGAHVARTAVGSSARSAAGVQAITGVGFKPTLVVITACDDVADSHSHGHATSSTDDECLKLINGAGGSISSGNIVDIDDGGGGTLSAVLTSMDSDGFTLTWSLGGAVDLSFVYECYA